MRENEAREALLERCVVTRQLVTLAKAFLLSPDLPNRFKVEEVAGQFAKKQGFEEVRQVFLHETIDPEPYIANAASHITCTLALNQAVWELIHSGYYMPCGEFKNEEPRQGWTTIIPGSGGHSGGWTFPELTVVFPAQGVVRSPAWRSHKPEPVTDPDMFVLEAGVEGADPEVIEALQDAVRCLRHGLYRPAVTLLGKAMEGAWIEMGIALASSLPQEANALRDKMLNTMKDENIGVAKKIAEVRKTWERNDLLRPVHKASDVRSQDLDSAVLWSDVVRDARNAIHFGAKPATANNYEKTVVLFLHAAKSLGLIYQVKRSAEQVRTK